MVSSLESPSLRRCPFRAPRSPRRSSKGLQHFCLSRAPALFLRTTLTAAGTPESPPSFAPPEGSRDDPIFVYFFPLIFHGVLSTYISCFFFAFFMCVCVTRKTTLAEPQRRVGALVSLMKTLGDTGTGWGAFTQRLKDSPHTLKRGSWQDTNSDFHSTQFPYIIIIIIIIYFSLHNSITWNAIKFRIPCQRFVFKRMVARSMTSIGYSRPSVEAHSSWCFVKLTLKWMKFQGMSTRHEGAGGAQRTTSQRPFSVD